MEGILECTGGNSCFIWGFQKALTCCPNSSNLHLIALLETGPSHTSHALTVLFHSHLETQKPLSVGYDSPLLQIKN